MSEQPYQSIQALLSRLQEQAERLKEGKLPAAALESMLHDAREVSDRLVVLRYKAYEDQVKPEGGSDNKNKPKRDDNKKKRDRSFQLDFHTQARMTAEENIIPRNQVSLIDAIEQEEKVPRRPQEGFLFQAPIHDAEEAEDDQETPDAEAEAPVAEDVADERDEQPTEAPTAPAEAPAPQMEQPPAALMDELQTPPSEFAESLNDRMKEVEEKSTLADKLQQSRIEDLSKFIGINQKFLFMNDLFEGEHAYYHEAINALNSCSSLSEAEVYLAELSDRYNWDWKSPSVKSFAGLVERRYH